MTMDSKTEDNFFHNYKIKKYDGPPYSYSVKVNGKIKKMSAFDEQHVKDQLYPRKPTRIIKLKERD